MSILKKILGNNKINVNLDEIKQKLNNCSTMRTEIEFVKGVGSNSSSPTDTYVLNIKQDTINERLKQNNQFFMKLFVVNLDKHYNNETLSYEQEIYRFTNKLLKQGNTRNLVPLVAHSKECTFNDICMMLSNKEGCADDIRQQLLFNLSAIASATVCSDAHFYNHKLPDRKAITSNKNKTNDIQKLMKADKEYFKQCAYSMNKTPEEFFDIISNFELGFIMTKSAQGTGSFYDFLTSKIATDDEMIQYIFQIFYTIHEFQLQGLNHNDLHLGNILMDQRWPSELQIALYVTSTGKVVVIKTNEVPRIFDYDRSTMKNFPNKLEDWLIPYGQVNKFSPQRDFLKIGCELLTQFSHFTMSNKYPKSYLAVKNSLELIPDSIESERTKTGNCFLTQSDYTSLLADDVWMNNNIRKTIDIVNILGKYADSGPCNVNDFTAQTSSKIKLKKNIYFASDKGEKDQLFKILKIS